MQKLDKNIPLYLIIHTDSYTGNFERELIGYCFGRLIGKNNYGHRKYISAFWNAECNHEIDSLEMLRDFNEKYLPKIKEESAKNLFETLVENKGLSKEEAEIRVDKFKEKIEKKDFEESLERIYDSVLLYTNQWNDDVKENTFYNIFSYSGDFCDSIYIQLNNLPEKFEEIFIRRIKDFFKKDIFNKIREYENLCCGNFEFQRYQMNLLDLELINGDMNIIKKYEI